MQVSSAELEVSYFQFSLQWDELDPGKVEFTGGNGLVWAGDGGLVVNTGLDSGTVPVTFSLLDRQPPVEPDAWNEIVEVSVHITGGIIAMCSPVGEVQQEIQISLPHDETRPFRVRVHARGRDAGHDAQFIDVQDGQYPIEEYQILCWPAPISDEVRWKLTDQVGQEMRSL